MTNDLIKVFASEEYLLLFWLSENLTESKRKTSVRFSQSEIAEELNCSPTTINKRMRLLQNCKCIRLDGKKGYEITNKGKSVLKIMKKLETVNGGN
ncbi:MAG: HTH domain-containing protein [Ruminococcaceae bacterium]|nr:HTH domain-containing protein [Oscillospiraceae bacterium]